MTETTQLNSRKPTFMSIGPLSLYCEHFKAAAARRFNEESTVQGEGVITNESGRAMEMTFSGRIYAGDKPLNSLLTMYNLLRGTMNTTVNYCGLVFSGCHMKAFSLEDSGLDYVDASITIITANAVTQESDET